MADTTNATAHEMTAATSGTSSPGAIDTTASEHAMEFATDGTSAPGVRVVQGSAHEITCVHEPGDTAGELYIMPAAYDADTVTTKACRTDGSDRFGPLKAVVGGSILEDRTDIVSTRVNSNYDGDLEISCTSIAESSIDGMGVIDYVVLHADCRIVHAGDAPVVTAPKFVLNHDICGDYETAMLTTPPIGLVGATDFSICSSGNLATYDGTHAWTWATMFAALTGLKASVHVHYTGSRVQADAAILWAEVYGPIGAKAQPIIMRQKMGVPIRKVVTFST